MKHFVPDTVLILALIYSFSQALPAPIARPIPFPAPAPQNTYYSDPAAIPTANPVGPPQASGFLRGGSSLIGYNPSNLVATNELRIEPQDFELAEGQTQDADLGLYLNFDGVENFQPIRGSTDSPTDPGPRTYAYERLNSDIYAPPSSDSGTVENSKWPLGLSHNRHGTPGTSGWARQQNIQQLPIATGMAGVDMRLSPNAYRELHWHTANEWSYMLNGSVRLVATNEAGEVFEDDLQAGDVWFFPAGRPHSIQALSDGAEFLLIFDDGSFSESGTSLVTEFFLRNPKEVLAKNFQTDVSSFDDLPSDELYIFPGTAAPANIEEQNSTGPAGVIPTNKTYSYHFSQQEPYVVPGGSIKIIDSVNFPVAENFAAALVTVEPGAMREMHWHTTSDEWNYFIQGQARITVYSAPSSSQTFDFSAGDVGYIPATDAHYIENTGNETVVFIEMLLQPKFSDISVAQWLGLTPKQVVKDTLHLPDQVLDNLPKVERYIVPGNPNYTTTNFTESAS